MKRQRTFRPRTRREFLGGCLAVSLGAPWMVAAAGETKPLAQQSAADWRAMRGDPVRELFAGEPDLDAILALFPRPAGDRPGSDRRKTPGVGNHSRCRHGTWKSQPGTRVKS